MKAFVAFGILTLVCAGPAVATSEHLGAKPSAAKIVDFDFAPRDLTVDAGASITWTNTGARAHTVSDRGGTFDTNPIAPGGQGSVTFSVPGIYHYFCRINPGRMNGIITVNGAGPAAKVNRIEGIDPGRPGETLRFVPPELEVSTGSTLVFANVGGKPHTLTADDRSFDTGVVTPGADEGKFAGTNASITLNKPGVFPFHCEVHAVMKGTLTVSGEEKEGPAPASNAARETAIEMKDFAFVKPEVSVAPGGDVVWRNTGEARHTATFDQVPLDTNVVQPGAEARLKAPDKPGSYAYKCNIHPNRMAGVLVVLGQNTVDPTKPAAGPAVAAGGGGPGGGVSALALATAVVGAFLGGFGISAFVRGSPGASAGS